MNAQSHFKIPVHANNPPFAQAIHHTRVYLALSGVVGVKDARSSVWQQRNLGRIMGRGSKAHLNSVGDVQRNVATCLLDDDCDARAPCPLPLAAAWSLS